MPGTLYLGASADVCFWEVFWDDLATRPPAERRLSHKKVIERTAWTTALPAALSLVNSTHPAGLQEMGAHGGTFRGPYSVCQAWAKALREHPQKPHGILYESVRLTGGLCVALFAEYAGTFALKFENKTPLNELGSLGDLLDKYGFLPVVKTDI
jgi:hypothetical protein